MNALFVSSTLPCLGREPGRERGLDPGQRQPALSGREAELRVPGGAERGGSPVHRQREAGGDLAEQASQDLALLRRRVDRTAAVRVEVLELLEGGDLGLVEDVVDLRVAVVDPHLGELVDGEVPERVRECRRRSRKRDRGERAGERGGADPQPAPAHLRPPSARSARGA